MIPESPRPMRCALLLAAAAAAFLAQATLAEEPDTGLPPEAQEAQRLIDEQLRNQAETLRKLNDVIQSNPALQKTMQFASNPKTIDSLEKIAKHPRRIHVLYLEAAWFLFILVVRAWLGATTRSLLTRLFFSLLISAAYFMGTLLIPLYILGAPFRTLLTIVISVIRNSP